MIISYSTAAAFAAAAAVDAVMSFAWVVKK